MKKFIYIALAAIAVLSSCAKENLVSKENGKEIQVFTATMEEGVATKVLFDTSNKCACWEEGDEISIDGHTYTATSAGASSSFTGSGATETPYHAYFPAGIYDGEPALPAVQTYAEGKFNMPMYAESSSLDLSFKNLCAVLAITVNSDSLVTGTTLKAVKVSSDQRMNGAFTATAAGDLTFTSQEELTDADRSVTLEISEEVDISTDRTFYVAIPAQEYSYLKIYLSADGETYREAMITQKVGGLGTIARSTIYNITYKTNAVQIYAGGPYWAMRNVGAATETDGGKYFAWGDATGQTPSEESSFDPGFGWEFCPFVEDVGTDEDGDEVPKFSKYVTQSSASQFGYEGFYDSRTILDCEDDAACANWGGGWRMPYKSEFDALVDACKTGSTPTAGGSTTTTEKGLYWCNDYDGVSGALFCNGAGYSLFLPAAGECTSSFLSSGFGSYWSSSLRQDYCRDAWMISLYSFGFSTSAMNRYKGFTVRPVSD